VVVGLFMNTSILNTDDNYEELEANFDVSLPKCPSAPLVAVAKSHLSIERLLESKDAISTVRRLIGVYGAVLFRSLPDISPDKFQQLVGSMCEENWAIYAEIQSPRNKLSDNVFTSTEYPPSQIIQPHHENAHRSNWPKRIFFYCSVSEMSGGATTIFDAKLVEREISKEILHEFYKRGVRYFRSFGFGIGFSWREAYGFDTPVDAQDYFQKNGIESDWIDSERLRVWYSRPAFVKHPDTASVIWCNNVIHYHPLTLDFALQRALKRMIESQTTPYFSAYGDGGSIPIESIAAISTAYERVKFPVIWKAGDFLALDNIRFSHGREAFSGNRRVFVAMSDPVYRMSDSTFGIAECGYRR